MNDDRAAAGLDHLQAAALELIQAARSFLDVAEDLVADQEKVAEVVSAFGTVADIAARAARESTVRDKSRPDRQADAATTGASGVQHIRVS